MFRRLALVLILLQLTLTSGCFFGSSRGPKPKDVKPTFPVTGVVHIDGQPAQKVHLFLNPAENALTDQTVQTTPNYHTASAVTAADGKFSFSTYLSGDGLPEGNYVISFYWDGGAPLDLFQIQDQEQKLSPVATKFNRKYGTPAKSEFKFTVEKGKPVDMKILELVTK